MMSWYILQTRPLYEEKIKKEILEKTTELTLPIAEVFSPEETVIDFKNGKKVEKSKRVYPNYLFINMEFSDIVWHHIKKIKGVVKFVGNKVSPTAMSEQEVAKMKQKLVTEAPKPRVVYEVDTRVRINNGTFNDFYGLIKAVDYDKNKARVAVTIFNRETVVELEITDLELAK